MESRGSWGVVYVATAFAVVVIGATLLTVYLQKKQSDAQVAAVAATLASAPQISDTVSSTSPGALSVGQAVFNGLSEGYAALQAQNATSSSDVAALTKSVVAQNVQPAAIVPNISLADLNVKDGAPVSTYLQLISVIMSQSSQVNEYEVSVFSQTVANNVTTGTPTLENDAALYRRIAAALLIMEVPQSLASKHLDVVKSVGALGNAVADMASWKGDPIEALVDIDAFNKAEAYAQNSVNALVAAATPLVKKT